MSKLTSIIAALALSTSPALADSFSGGICLAPTEFHIGEVGSNQIALTATPTVSTSVYAVNESIGGLMTLSNAARISAAAGASGTSGLIQSVMMATKTNQPGGSYDVMFFDANPSGSTCTDNNPFILAAADIGKVIGVSHLADATAGNPTNVWQDLTMRTMPYALNSSTTIYACAITRVATPTYTSTSDVTFKFQVVRE